MIGQIDKYLLEECLGKGNFGTVYRALDLALNEVKAIKVLSVGNIDDFQDKLREAQILSQVRHKHIVSINEANVFEVEGAKKLIIDMEFISGGSVETFMQQNFVSVKKARNIFIDILLGLEHAHTKYILHRDIKPANIMIADNCAKLSDFGLATIVGSRDGEPDFGYVSHFAPEFILEGKSTKLTDVFAVGVTLFRVVNNINNWRSLVLDISDLPLALEKASLIRRIGYRNFVPKQLKKIIKKATNRDTRKRYQSADEFRRALDRLNPGIEWIPISDSIWEGENPKGDLFSLAIKPTRHMFRLELKKNHRKVNSKCGIFCNLESAQKAMEDYICETTLE